VKFVAVTVMVLTVVAIVADRRPVRTGELLVQADRSGVRVSILRGGRVIIPWTDRRSFTLPPGEYEVALDAPPLAPRPVPSRVSVTRGGRAVVTIAAP
jgi:hypothetical protein